MAVFLPWVVQHKHEHQHVVSSLHSGRDPRINAKLTEDEFLNTLTPRKTRQHVGNSPYTRYVPNKGKNPIVLGNPENFEVNIDVQQFLPEDISVKCVNGDTVVVECKNEEKQDEHGYIFRHFIRKYQVPERYDIKKCISQLSSDGVLTITIPKVEIKNIEIQVPVIFTYQPSQIQISAQKASESTEQEYMKNNSNTAEK